MTAVPAMSLNQSEECVLYQVSNNAVMSLSRYNIIIFLYKVVISTSSELQSKT